jgi:sugar phosphate isomerase/epimerase
VTLTRRGFLASVPAAALAAGIRAQGEEGSGMCLAYTSFAVRMLQGRDILKSTAAALPASALLDLCVRFGAHGAQIDWSQIESHDPAALAALKDRADRDRLKLELSVPASCLESPQAYGDMVKTATALGVTHVRIALLYGRRYESFKTRDEWTAWHAKWAAQLQTMKPVIESHPVVVGLENHKDHLSTELAALLHSLNSARIGVCFDFGNNLSLLEEPQQTLETLAPFVVTTHLKDMAVKPTADGFELSEVPLGEGILPLAEMIATLRAHRPDVPMCLEMLTRDPLQVPYKTDRYWIALDRPAPQSLAAFEHHVLSRASPNPVPHITGLPPADQIALEDELVRRCMEYGRRTLQL